MQSTWSLAHTLSGEFFSELFRSNVLLSAQARQHSARGFRGPLSIKGVVRGEARWTVDGRQYLVDATSCLVVNRDQAYDLQIEATEPVETFVVFFCRRSCRRCGRCRRAHPAVPARFAGSCIDRKDRRRRTPLDGG